MPRFEALRNYNIGDSAGTFHIIKGNIYTFPNDYVPQHRLDRLLAGANPVLREWTLPEVFKSKV